MTMTKTLVTFFIIALFNPLYAKNIEQHSKTKTIGIVSGSIGGTYARFAQDLATATFDIEKFRVLPIISTGSVQNISDLLWLSNVDVAIIQSDVLTAAREIDLTNDITNKISYIAKLYNEEFHVLVRNDIRGIKELNGKNVSIGPKGSGTAMSASTIFDSFDLEIRKHYLSNDAAIDKLDAGEIDAAVMLSGKPSSTLLKVPAKNNYKILTLNLDKQLSALGYGSSALSDLDYPNLIPEGQTIETISVDSILAAYNWKKDTNRYKRINEFKETLSSLLPILQSDQGYHQKWKTVDLNSKVKGWNKF